MKYIEMILISLAISLGVIAAYQKFILPKKKEKIYVVDTSKLINAEKRLLSLGLKEGKINADKVKALDKKFKKIISYIAKRDNAVILVKRAILSDNYDKDVTNEVLRFGLANESN